MNRSQEGTEEDKKLIETERNNGIRTEWRI
jgi:hypothetical protein